MSNFKQAVIDILIRYRDSWQGDYYVPFQKAIDEVNALPSAEPEIIRCKDCKWHYDKNNDDCYHADDEGFCAWAERREEE